MTTILIRLALAGIRKRLLPSGLTIVLSATVAATLVIALEVGATTRDPWQRTFDVAHGADVLANVATEADAQSIASHPGVSEASGPIPSRLVQMDARSHDVPLALAGLDARPSVNIPVSTEGAAPGSPGVVLERSLAEALGLHPGMTIELSSADRSIDLELVGTAVLPSQPRYPRATPGLASIPFS